MRRKYKIGLVLSGGGTRGIAHLGAIKALEEYGLKPDVISGVSAGAIIGSLYASGVKPSAIFDLLCKKEFYNCSKLSFGFKGFLEMKGIRQDLSKFCKKTFSDLEIPLFVGATNLNTGKIEYFNSGELIDKVIASSSIPILYDPIKLDGTTYVDGGIVDNMPISPIQNTCAKLIGVNVNPVSESEEINNVLEVLTRTFQIISRSNVEGTNYCDLLIEPEELVEYSFLNNAKAHEVFEIGYNATVKEINRWLQAHKTSTVKGKGRVRLSKAS